MRIVAPIPQQGRPRIHKKPNFFEKHKKIIQNAKTQNVQRYANISDIPFDQRCLIHREAWFPPCFVRQNQPKKTFLGAILDRFQTKMFKSETTSFITFPQGFRISKNIGHPILGSGVKKTIKGYLRTTVGWTKNTRKPIFEKRKKSSKTQKLKNVQRYANINDIPFDQRSLIHREAGFPPCFVRQNQPKNKLFFARQFQTTSKQKCSNVRPLLSITFPQGFRISKNIGHPTSGSGGKKTVKRYLKSEQTDRQTHKRTDISTYRKHRPRGPML